MIDVSKTGHEYHLEAFEGGDPVAVTFINKEPKPSGEQGELVTVHDGTTNEEVLAMLIDRLKKLGARFPCPENRRAIEHCEGALYWLNLRTKRRRMQGVEGKHITHESNYPEPGGNDVRDLREITDRLLDLMQRTRIEALGWAWAEACLQLDAGKDPRQYDQSELMQRANTELI